jgi:hypothetical protein
MINVPCWYNNQSKNVMDSRKKTIKPFKTFILTLLAAFVFTVGMKGQLSATNMSDELKSLDKLIRDIKWDTYSKYLLYHNISSSMTEIEESQNIEIWMVDLGCWNFKASEKMNELLCVQEFEYDYPIENWMLKEFNIPLQNNPELENEENYQVEDWMYNLQGFQGMN